MPARVQPKIRPEQVIEGVSAQRRPAPLPAPPRRSPGRALSRRGREGWKPSSRHLLKPPPHPRSLRAAERVFQPRGRLCARGRLRAAAGAGLLGGGAHGAQAAHRLLPRLSAPGRQPQKARFPSLFLSLSHYLALGARGPPKREAARWEGETAFARSTKALVKLAQVGQQILKQVVPNMRRYGKWAVVTGATANSKASSTKQNAGMASGRWCTGATANTKASSTKHAQVWQVGGGDWRDRRHRQGPGGGELPFFFPLPFPSAFPCPLPFLPFPSFSRPPLLLPRDRRHRQGPRGGEVPCRLFCFFFCCLFPFLFSALLLPCSTRFHVASRPDFVVFRR